MKYSTYILYSFKIEKHYVGYTSDLEKRLNQHNANKHKYTSRSDDWIMIWSKEFESKTEAIIMENKIKKIGCKRFLKNLKDKKVLSKLG